MAAATGNAFDLLDDEGNIDPQVLAAKAPVVKKEAPVKKEEPAKPGARAAPGLPAAV